MGFGLEARHHPWTKHWNAMLSVSVSTPCSFSRWTCSLKVFLAIPHYCSGLIKINEACHTRKLRGNNVICSDSFPEGVAESTLKPDLRHQVLIAGISRDVTRATKEAWTVAAILDVNSENRKQNWTVWTEITSRWWPSITIKNLAFYLLFPSSLLTLNII